MLIRRVHAAKFGQAVRWTIRCGDILDEPADVLICSANPFLSMSGGVGGAYLLRYGVSVQDELRAYLAARNVRLLPRGSVVQTSAGGGPYLAVLHAIGVDAAYETSAAIVAETITRALEAAAALQARKVAVAAIGTGYGKLSLDEFAAAIQTLKGREFPPMDEVAICLRKVDEFAVLMTTWTDER